MLVLYWKKCAVHQHAVQLLLFCELQQQVTILIVQTLLVALLRHRCDIITALLRLCYGFDMALLQLCDGFVTTLLRLCYDSVTTLLWL